MVDNAVLDWAAELEYNQLIKNISAHVDIYDIFGLDKVLDYLKTSV